MHLCKYVCVCVRACVYRVLTLKALCDLRAERDDLRYLIEEAVEAADGPSSTRSKASKQPSEGAVAGMQHAHI